LIEGATENSVESDYESDSEGTGEGIAQEPTADLNEQLIEVDAPELVAEAEVAE
jgi:hypothetical protein